MAAGNFWETFFGGLKLLGNKMFPSNLLYINVLEIKEFF